MISCEQFLAELDDDLEGEVGAALRRELEYHHAHCRTCEVLYDSARKSLKIVTESSSFELGHGVAETLANRIMERIRARQGGQS